MFAENLLRQKAAVSKSKIWQVIGASWVVIGLSIIAQTGNIYAGLYYPMIVAGITFVIGSVFLKETRGRKIWEEVQPRTQGQSKNHIE